MASPIKTAEFVKSSTDPKDFPAARLPEYAFVGRSNVGKSSLINMLVERNSLAKTSATPGKTKLVNHFIINSAWFLVDLPGYGYAKISKSERKTFLPLIENYLRERTNLMNVFLLVDCRHEPQKSDLDFADFLGYNGVPFSIVFTKTDKLTHNELQSSIAAYKKVLLKSWEELPKMFFTSASEKKGREAILEYIEEINQIFQLPETTT